MKKLILTECKICGKKLNSRGFSFHCTKTHNLSVEEYIIKYELNGTPPLCKCGCGTPTTIRSYQIMDYANHHSPAGKIKNGEFRKRNVEKWKNSLSRSRKEFFKLYPEKSLGKNNNFFGKKHSESTKNKIRNSLEKYIQSGCHPFLGKHPLKSKKTDIEIKMENYLQSKNLQHEYNFPVKVKIENKIRYRYYDFYIKSMNLLLEVHGTFWHPKSIDEAKYESQKNAFENDKFKKREALKNGYNFMIVYDTQLDDFIKNNGLYSKTYCSYIPLKNEKMKELQVEV